jgi:epoxide hydrolase-like predicted phosphatase
MIKAVIFDCYGVLTTDLWKEFVATLQPDQVAPARKLNYLYDSADINLETFLEQVQSLTGRDRSDLKWLVEVSSEKNLELIDYIRHLKTNYKIAMLSNVGTNWVRDKFLSLDEQKLFDVFIFSYEVKLAKPDPEIFQLLAKELSLEAEECVLIDDGPGNVKAAKRLGMEAIVYKNFVQMKSELEKLINPKS